MTVRPWASVSLDLDNQWSYQKTHGDAGWETFPSYLDLVVPRILKFLSDRRQRITFFIVGQDAALEKNHAAIRSIADAGHEIANHSFHHDPWLHRLTEQQLHDELARTEECLEQVTGVRPRGFRGPGFSCSPTTLKVLSERGYHYDASTFPTYLGPLARAYYFMTARFDAAEKEVRSQMFGTLREGLRPLRPYYWQLGQQQLLEIPVTTLPIFRTPIHQSYLSYLRQFSGLAAHTYWEMTMRLCRVIPGGISVLLHPLDFLGGDDVPALSFFPGMKLDSVTKLKFLGRIIDRLASSYEILTMAEHAQRIQSQPRVLASPRQPENK